MRILVVEDDKKIASFVLNGLKQAGFVVDHADDGQSGLDLALGGSYDVAVIDIMLPKLDGLSVIEQLRQHEVRTPVIILSAKRSVDDRIKGLQKGGDDYLTKPFGAGELLARIRVALRHRALRNAGQKEPVMGNGAEKGIAQCFLLGFQEGLLGLFGEQGSFDRHCGLVRETLQNMDLLLIKETV